MRLAARMNFYFVIWICRFNLVNKFINGILVYIISVKYRNVFPIFGVRFFKKLKACRLLLTISCNGKLELPNRSLMPNTLSQLCIGVIRPQTCRLSRAVMYLSEGKSF